MTTPKDVTKYESWWRTIYEKGDTTFEIVLDSKKQAMAVRLRAYGFQRAVRELVADPMTSGAVRTAWFSVFENIEVKEVLLRPGEGSKWKVVIGPRTQTMPTLVEVPTDMEKVIPAIRGIIESGKEEVVVAPLPTGRVDTAPSLDTFLDMLKGEKK